MINKILEVDLYHHHLIEVMQVLSMASMVEG